MAVNQFERPLQNTYNFQTYVPNFDAWDSLLGTVQGEINQAEALMAKTPDYIQYSQTDQAGAQEYRGFIQDTRSRLADAFEQGASKGRLAMNSAMYEIMEQWTPGGLASQLESRLAEENARESEIRELFENNPNELPFAIAQQRAQIQDLRNSAGGFQGVGQAALPNPMEAEALSKWMEDNRKGIMETVLSDDVIRRAVAGNKYETIQDIILETRGVTANRVFGILAQMLPQEFKQWYQFKHDAMSYNSGGQYKPGDQTKLYDVRTIQNDDGTTAQVIDPNLDSELGRMLWAKANGAAYVEHVRTTAKLTDWEAKKKMEMRIDNPYINPHFAGPSFSTKLGGRYNGVRTFSDIIGLEKVNQSIVNDARNELNAMSTSVAQGDPSTVQRNQAIMDNVEVGLNSTMTDQQALSLLKSTGVDDRTANQYIKALRDQQRDQDIFDQIMDDVQEKTGINPRNLDADLAARGISGSITTEDGRSISASEILSEIAVGGKIGVRKVRGSNYSPQQDSFYYQDHHGNIIDLTPESFRQLQGLTQTEAVQGFLSDVSYINNSVNLEGMFNGEYVSTTTVPMYIPVADEDGVLSMTLSQKWTDNFRERLKDPTILANYPMYDPKDPSSVTNISVADAIDENGSMPIMRDSNGNPDWSTISINPVAQRVPGRGWVNAVGYFDVNGSPQNTYIPATREQVELNQTQGRGYSRLSPIEYVRVQTDDSFNGQLDAANQTFGGFNPASGLSRELRYPVTNQQGLTIGNFVYSKGSANPVTRTDQGAPTQPTMSFEYYQDGKPIRVSTDKARDIFFEMNLPQQP